MNDIPSGETVPPYIRSITRDLKNYIAQNSPRKIPIGYSAADVRDILADSWAYLECAIDGSSLDNSKIDFFGLNSYSWCGGDATFETSGYNILVSQFANTSIPVFFSEYGCNEVRPRVFNEVLALYGPNMTSVMSGGLVYEYVQEEANNFGLVVLYQNDTAELMVDYDNLQHQYNKLDIKALESGNPSATKVVAPTCKSSLIGSSNFVSKFSLVPIPAGGQSLIDKGIEKPNNGKLVDISDTNVLQPVYSSSGGKLQNLSIKKLPDDETNIPNGTDTSGSATNTAPSPNSTPTHKSAAPHSEKGLPRGLLGPLALIAILLVK